jgi:apolipoprotein N-acyltransferase
MLSTRPNRILAALLSGALLAGVLNLHPWWPLAWIAPIPLLLATFHSLTSREARWLSLVAACIGLSVNFSYYNEALRNPILSVVLILLQSLLWFSIVPATRRVLVERSSPWMAIFAYPLQWAAFETLIAAFSPHGNFSSFAFTQADVSPVTQIASLAGTPGVVFTISIFVSTVAVSLYRRAAYWQPLVIVACVIAFGFWRIATEPPPLKTVKVGLIAIDDFIGPRMPPAFIAKVWDRYEAAIAELAAQGARIVLLPEKIEVLDEEPGKQRLAWLAALARKNRVFVGVGLGIRSGQTLFNRFWIFSPEGAAAAVYDKQYPVPGLEREFTAGRSSVTYEIDGSLYGLAICKDMHFPALGRSYAGVDAMLIPAWDFDRDDWWTARMTSLRGIENGFPVIRASRQGFLTVSDRTGRIVAEKRSSALPGVTLLADSPVGGARTFYGRFGDVFGWLCVALAIGVRLVMVRSFKRGILPGKGQRIT